MNQVVGQFLELGVPFAMKLVGKVQKDKNASGNSRKKSVAWHDEKNGGAAATVIPDRNEASVQQTEEDEDFLADVRKQVALPDYDVFGDYSEMVTQFGYVVLWSTCWFLAPIGALVNNWFELREDAIKITKFGRRPIPRRVDSIGSWLDILSFLTWQGALVNSALVYLFYHPLSGTTTIGNVFPTDSNSTASTQQEMANEGDALFLTQPITSSAASTLRSAIFPALLIALSTSHIYLLVRTFVRHILVRAVWRGSQEAVKLERSEKDAKRAWLKDVGGNARVQDDTKRKIGDLSSGTANGTDGEGSLRTFWDDDEGLTEVRRGSKVM